MFLSDLRGWCGQEQTFCKVLLALSSLKTATAVERIFPFIPENLINTPFLPAGRCSGSAFEITSVPPGQCNGT